MTSGSQTTSISPITSCSIAIARRQGRQGRAAVRRPRVDLRRRRRALARARALAASTRGLAPEQRVYIVLPDTPAFAWSIFGTLAAGGVVTMGNPIVADRRPRVRARLRARGRADHDAGGRGGARDRASRELPRLRAVLLAPDAATGDDPEATAMPRLEVRRGVAGSHGDRAAAASRRPPLPTTPSRRSGDLAVHVGLDGPARRRRCTATATSRSTPRCYAKRTIGYARGRRHGQRAAPVLRLRDRHEPVVPVRGRRDGRPVQRAADRRERSPPRSRATARRSSRTCRRCSASCSISTTSAARAASPGSICRRVRFHFSAGEALPEPLLRRFIERFGGQVYDGIGSAEMFHIYCSNRPGDVKPGSLGRVVEGYELEDPRRGCRRPRRARAAARRDRRAVGQGRQRRARLLPRSRQELEDVPRPLVPHRRSVLDRRATATCTSRAAPTICSRSAACSSRRARSRTACSAHPAVSVVAVIPAEDQGLTKPKAVVVLRPEARDRGPRGARRRAQGPRPGPAVQAQVPAMGRVRRRSAEERSRQGRQEDCCSSARNAVS